MFGESNERFLECEIRIEVKYEWYRGLDLQVGSKDEYEVFGKCVLE